MADEMLLSGQRVLPRRATEEGFKFAYPQLDQALKHALCVK
jgi:NAD dependent epimerase/dehydratase family enzyme